MKICFIDRTKFKYNSSDLYSHELRAGETTLINLSKSLKNIGHQLSIINNCPRDEIIDGINWYNIDNYNKNTVFDLAISNNDTRLFDVVRSKKNILISHSVQSIEKFVRKKQFFGFVKYKPIIALLGKYHMSVRPKILRLFGYVNLSYGLSEIFNNSEVKININKNQAIFTSRSDRNLELLINIWKDYIYPNKKNAELLVTPGLKINQNLNIKNRVMSDTKKLIQDISNSRMFLVPVHKSELFCLAAAEAKELCIPIVTLGIGSLKERVDHGVTGFIAKNKYEFAKYSLDLFNNDVLWNKLRNNLIKNRGKYIWDNQAKIFIDNINKI